MAGSKTCPAPGRGDRPGPALGGAAQAGPGQDDGPVPGHGGLRPGRAPGRDRGRASSAAAAVDGLIAADRAARRRRHLPADAPVVRPPPDRARLRRGQADLLRPAARRRAARSWSGSTRLVRGERRAVHARVRPAVLPGDAPAPRAAGDDARPAPADPRPGPPVRLRPLRPARPLDPDRPGAAADRPGQLPARLVPLPLPGRADRRSRAGAASVLPDGAGAGDPDFESFLARVRRRGRWPRSRLGRYHRAAWGEASRFLPQPGLPGLRRARGRLARDARPDPVVRRRGDPRGAAARWSRPSARCSTTSSTAWSAASQSLAPTLGRRPRRRPARRRPPPEPARGAEDRRRPRPEPDPDGRRPTMGTEPGSSPNARPRWCLAAVVASAAASASA